MTAIQTPPPYPCNDERRRHTPVPRTSGFLKNRFVGRRKRALERMANVALVHTRAETSGRQKHPARINGGAAGHLTGRQTTEAVGDHDQPHGRIQEQGVLVSLPHATDIRHTADVGSRDENPPAPVRLATRPRHGRILHRIAHEDPRRCM